MKQNKQNRLLGSMAVIVGLMACAAHAETLTLNQAIIRALEHDPTIRKIYTDVMSADGYATEVRSSMRPQLTMSSDAGYGYRSRSIGGLATGGQDLFDRRAGLIVEQLIWDNGFSCFKWKDAKCRKKAAVLLDRAQRETTAMATVSAYLYVLKARKQIELARENVASHTRFFQLAGQRAGGIGEASDVELSRARLDLSRTLLRERELDLKQAEADFVRYVCIQPPNLCSPQVPTIHCVGDIDPTQNYHYQAVIHQCGAAKLAQQAIEKSHGPQMLFRGTGSYGEDVQGITGTDEEVSALLVMEWKLVEGGRKKGLLNQAAADVARQVAVADETEVLLKRDIQARWADYSTLQERISILEDYSRGLGDTVGLYQDQFELNKRPLLGVLDIENEKISSEMRLVDERTELALNAYRLLFFGGKLACSTVGTAHLECEPACLPTDCPGGCINCEDECNGKCDRPEVSVTPIRATPVHGGSKGGFKLFNGVFKKNR